MLTKKSKTNCSYWTKRRKIQTEVDSLLQVRQNRTVQNYVQPNYRSNLSPESVIPIIPNNIDIVDDQSQSPDIAPLIDLNFSFESNDNNARNVSANMPSLDSDDPENISFSFCESNENGSMIDFDSIYNSSESEDDSDCNDDFKLVLKMWALNNQITHNALKDLLLVLRRFTHFDLPIDPRTLLGTKVVEGIKEKTGGLYYHFGVSNGLNQLLKENPELMASNTVYLQINIDGLPLFKSNSLQLWPILGLILQSNAPYTEPFVIGVFSGNQKPTDVNEFLKEFVDEMLVLSKDGLNFNGHHLNVTIKNFICDTPARSFVKCVKSHNGYSGCDKCITEGTYMEGRMTFPDLKASLRNDVMFDEKLDEEHHRGDSILSSLGLGMVSAFPLDYMHLICLGIMKKLLSYWTKGPLNVRIGRQIKCAIDASLLSFVPYIPKEFSRKPRSLVELDRWKATELRLFLLYTGPVIVVNSLSEEVVHNFLLFSSAIHILVSPSLCQKYADYAQQLLVSFISHSSNLYGPSSVVYNMHAVIHLPEDVKRFGSLDNFSAFPFENFLGRLKRLIRKPSFPLSQLVTRLLELKHMPHFPKFETPSLHQKFGLKKEHSNGPLVAGEMCVSCSQFKQATINNILIGIGLADSCVQIEKKVVLIKNIILHANKVYVIYQFFSSCKSFFLYPLESSLLDILVVSDVDKHLNIASAESITCKYVRLPYQNKHVVFPLRHTLCK